MSNTIEIDKTELTQILNQNEELKKDMATLKNCVVSAMDLMGIIDKETGTIKPEIESGKESFIPPMIKSLGDVVYLLTKASSPKWMGGSEKNKAALGERFSFITEGLPLIKKYQ